MYSDTTSDYARIEKAIQFIERNFQDQPDLSTIANHLGLSDYHFQRLFTRWAGISPKRFLQYLTLNYAKELLATSHSLLETTYETGLSSPGRLHDLFITYEAITPGDFKRNGEGLAIAYGFHQTPFGECLLAVTKRGICNLMFVVEGEHQKAINAVAANWRGARLVEDAAQTRPYTDQLFAAAESAKRPSFHLLLKGTNFQVQVWQALLKIPVGTAVTYGDVAKLAGRETAVRAVGSAVSRNPIAYLIPCHRVIRQTGGFGEYRWGAPRKKAILGWEAAQRYRQTKQSVFGGTVQ